MKRFAQVALAGCLLIAAGAAHADETKFLQSFKGNFAGEGTVQVTTDVPNVSVSCNFKSNATATSLSWDMAICRGLVVVSRAISADTEGHRCEVQRCRISGSRTGPAQLNGSRSGNVINLGIRWAKDVNGDRKAKMTVEKRGENGIRLTVIDTDPKTGKSVVTSRIDLTRT